MNLIQLQWRAAVLGFIRDRVESAEIYRLGEADLQFGELLPEKPGWLEQEEYEERNQRGIPSGTALEESWRSVAERIGDCRATS